MEMKIVTKNVDEYGIFLAKGSVDPNKRAITFTSERDKSRGIEIVFDSLEELDSFIGLGEILKRQTELPSS